MTWRLVQIRGVLLVYALGFYLGAMRATLLGRRSPGFVLGDRLAKNAIAGDRETVDAIFTGVIMPRWEP